MLNNIPPKRADNKVLIKPSTSKEINALNFAVHLNSETPDFSALKYAISAITPRANNEAAVAIFNYALNLSWHFPALLPLLEKIDARSNAYNVDATHDKSKKIITINSLYSRPDGMCRALYYLKLINREPSSNLIMKAVNSEYYAVITILCKFNRSIALARIYALRVINNATLYEPDQNWLLLYELFLHDHIDAPYPDESTFALLKKYACPFYILLINQAAQNNFAKFF
ncbi:hypothetical protein [Pseudomonas syringae]|uniref:hypothetical protein n=1 Tax=Pseudomonas syringae TaxID=317 RepID=UPI0015E1872B|nr:hypothetical protein [Pseudomonas syringae]